MKIVIPMAGRGSRFVAKAHKNSEYKKPKPFIMIKGKPMIEWAIKSLPFIDMPDRPANTKFKAFPEDLVFISLKHQQRKYGILDRLKELFSPKINVILIPEVTRGAVETALAAREYISADEDLIISDSDHYFDGTNLYKAIMRKDEDTAGIIPVFPPPDEEVKWSYTLFDKNIRVATAVGEKDPRLVAKGAFANIGGYYFSNGKIFVDEAEKMIKEGDMYGAPGKEEFYVAPIYQRLISRGMKIQVAVIPQVWGLGTPKDVEYFEQNYKIPTQTI